MAAKRFSNSATSGPFNLPHLPLRKVRSSRLSSVLPKIGHNVNGSVRIGLPPNSASFSGMVLLRFYLIEYEIVPAASETQASGRFLLGRDSYQP